MAPWMLCLTPPPGLEAQWRSGPWLVKGGGPGMKGVPTVAPEGTINRHGTEDCRKQSSWVLCTQADSESVCVGASLGVLPGAPAIGAPQRGACRVHAKHLRPCCRCATAGPHRSGRLPRYAYGGGIRAQGRFEGSPAIPRTLTPADPSEVLHVETLS